MIHTDLLDLINSGDAWVLVGSGVSTNAGLPSWADLVTLTLDQLSSDNQNTVKSDTRFRQWQERNDFAKCLQRMQDIAGQGAIVDIVRKIILEKTAEPSGLTRLLSDWPAAGYLTTNYDHLIEAALEINNSLGWIPVGNTPSEVRKVSGDVRNIVWHIHGSAQLPNDKSRLVLGSNDYEDLYIERSELEQQLKSFLTQRRLVFVGFGLQDPEIMRLLRFAGRYTIPERPIYAFLGSKDSAKDEAIFQELRYSYNVEVIPYNTTDDSHSDLRDLLDVYSSMIVRRSVNYGQRLTSVPSYDPDTTGLLIYNRLVLQNPEGTQGDTMKSLLCARILSVVAHQDSMTLSGFRTDVGRIATRISGGIQEADDQSSEDIESVVEETQEKKSNHSRFRRA